MIITVDTEKESPEGLKRVISLLEDVLEGRSPKPSQPFVPKAFPPTPPPQDHPNPQPVKPAPRRVDDSSSVVQIY